MKTDNTIAKIQEAIRKNRLKTDEQLQREQEIRTLQIEENIKRKQR